MPREPIAQAAVLSTPAGTFGDLATAAFIVAAATGVAVAVPYDSHDAYGSIAALLLANPAAAFFRNLHYWSSQFCLVLTLIHVWDHLRARTEAHVGRGVWLRLTLALPLVAFLMLSGFLLRGDAEGRQALRILAEATGQIPAVGTLLATFLFGTGERLNLVYVQHAATATIIVWLFVIEHARRVWPRGPAFILVTLVSAALSLVVSPGLHDGLDPVVKGPWYFLGLQEILHWTRWPLAVVLGGVAVVALLYLVRVVNAAWTARLKVTLLVVSVLYVCLCGVGAFMRGDAWMWQPGWPNGAADLRAGFVFGARAGAPAPLPVPLPVALDRPEGCLVCHSGVIGLGNAHRPEAIGCASCHGGDVFTLDKRRAHGGMTLIPGNLATARRACGQGPCHPTVVPRVERSIMTTMSGIVGVDRLVFGEIDNAAAREPMHVQHLGSSPADTHLRQLCASCHLGRAKTDLGPTHEDSRGGGCDACHLSYSSEALAALRRYVAEKPGGQATPPAIHPAVSVSIGNGQCFGCHSRSGRISTSYEGWQERHEPPAAASDPLRPAPSSFRVLEDGRVFERTLSDVHQQRGLDCIDCHTALEVMGDGTLHGRKSGQVRVVCEDCHARPGTVRPAMPASQLDPESKRILALRAWLGPAASRVGLTRAGDAFVNVAVDAAGSPTMVRKNTGERRTLKPALPVCVEGQGHARLSCGSCHTAWAPRCPTCHTAFTRTATGYDWLADAEVRGAWEETPGPYTAEPPTLGVRVITEPGPGRREMIDTFEPGMILTIDRANGTAGPGGPLFRRLYARVEPHTTRREARSCRSCHNDPVALGYGHGTMRYVIVSGRGRWTFAPAASPMAVDGLPSDAWIPFLGAVGGLVSTRDDVRPFTVEEQKKILRVGACLTCHDATSPALRGSVRDFEARLRRRSPRCVLPEWD